jgi:hypothetical protein
MLSLKRDMIQPLLKYGEDVNDSISKNYLKYFDSYTMPIIYHYIEVGKRTLS